MDFSGRRRDHKVVIEVNNNYPHVLNFYKKPPTDVIHLSEFEEIAIERMKLLRVIEQTTLLGHKIYSKDWKEKLLHFCRKEGLKKFVKLIDSSGNGINDADENIRRYDHISHFILRLAYCRSQDLRYWFLQRESELFRFRFMNLTPESANDFIRINELSLVPISPETKEELKTGLMDSTYWLTQATLENTDFFKVCFTDVPNLCAKRLVYLKNGYAYVPSNELVSCVLSTFKENLHTSLNIAVKRLPAMEDDRLHELLKMLHAANMNMNFYKTYRKTDGNAIELSSLDTLSRSSFPLCMRSIHELLRTTHHVKHFARLQYTLFLKGIGLSMEDAITFWRQELTNSIGEDKFNKEYLYNVKHSYGAIGSKRDYAPQSCMKIISASLSVGDQHGCPFISWDTGRLTSKFRECGLSEQGIYEIVDLAKKGHYQIACSKFFVHTHKTDGSTAINHPNQYFEESQQLITNTTNKKRPRGQRTNLDLSESSSMSSLNDNFDM